MSTTRQNKFARLIQKELSGIFLRDGAFFYGNAFVTITIVRATPDLSMVRVYLSLFGVKDREQIMEQVSRHTKEIRKRLGERIKHQVRHVPQLEFFLDDSFDYAEKIDKLLQTIHVPPADEKK